MMGKAFFVVLSMGIVATTVSAATVYMEVGNLGTYGWNTVVVQDTQPRGAVTNRVQTGSNGLQFTNGDWNKTQGCWAAISTANYAGVSASSITALNVRLWGHEGDGTDWQPPMLMFTFQKAPGNLSNRYAWWVPWSDGVARAPQTWQTLDALVDGSWVIPNVGGTYTTFAAMLAAYPDLLFPTEADLATMGGVPAGAHSFNLGFATSPFGSSVKTYTDSARGTVDWFEVGISGSVTRYDLFDVPEPATMLMLALGGLALRRRR